MAGRAARRIVARYLLTAGGIDVQEDVLHMLPSLSASMDTFDSKDIAHATYVFDILASFDNNPAIRSFYGDLATTYARRFAEWLGYVFLNRANMTRQSKEMKGLEEGLSSWVEALPEMLPPHPAKSVVDFLPEASRKFLDAERLDKIGDKVLRVLSKDFVRTMSRQANVLESLPISYNNRTRLYEIPKSSLTYTNRAKLRDLGFKFDGNLWTTPTLETEALEALPQVEKIKNDPPPPQAPPRDPREWFFHEWLPKNIDRFSKVFDEYGKAEGVPYSFQFVVRGEDVVVTFKRNIKTIDEAVRELESRYGGAGDREGWMTAIECWHELMRVRGGAAMQAIDKANNLEHSHGAMMEHFPPGVRAWYPAFLDFKYTASPWQMVRSIDDEDLRVIASELMPLQLRMIRLAPTHTDERTPKGLALEISSQPGKPAKKKMLALVQKTHPDMYPKVVKLLEERGLHLV